MALIIIFIYLSMIKLQETISVENVDVGGFAFQFKFFFSLFPAFARSFLSIEWFSIFTYLYLAGICLIHLEFQKIPFVFVSSFIFSRLFIHI